MHFFLLVVKCVSGNGIPTKDKAHHFTFSQNQNDGVKKKTNNFKLSTELVKYFPVVTDKRQEARISIKIF